MNSSSKHPLVTNPSNEDTNDFPVPSGYAHSDASQCLTKQPQAVGNFPAPGELQSAGGESNWVPVPLGIPLCPPGLEYLTMVDQLLVHQKIEALEILLGCETRNKYTIKNSVGQTVYRAEEDTSFCNRFCLGTLRPFDLRITDYTGREVISIYREYRCMGCCCPCCLQRMEVYTPPGNLVGVILQEWSICRPKYKIETPTGDVVFNITGPICTFSCCADVDFPVLAPNGVEVGKITKQWSGLVREMFTDADHFGITFPMNLDVNMKAVLLGALFLIDFNFFERQNN